MQITCHPNLKFLNRQGNNFEKVGISLLETTMKCKFVRVQKNVVSLGVGSGGLGWGRLG